MENLWYPQPYDTFQDSLKKKKKWGVGHKQIYALYLDLTRNGIASLHVYKTQDGAVTWNSTTFKPI